MPAPGGHQFLERAGQAHQLLVFGRADLELFHVRGKGVSVTFTGTGLGLLGQTLLWLACSVLIVPIPWVLRSIYRWFTGHLLLWREDVEEWQEVEVAVTV